MDSNERCKFALSEIALFAHLCDVVLQGTLLPFDTIIHMILLIAREIARKFFKYTCYFSLHKSLCML